jgi:hypothetical protein
MRIIENGKWLTLSISPNGDRFYYYESKLHRERGPAIELAAGGKVWYHEGKKSNAKSQTEFEQIITKTAAIQPRYFDIKIETNLLATLSYRVLAQNPEEALDKARHSAPQSVKHRLQGKRDIKGTVYEMGSSMIKLVQNLVGR